MKLEDEIFNKTFASNYHKASVNILYTYGWISNLIRKELDIHNITMQQYNVLRILKGQYPKPATINTIRERMLDKMSDASRIVDRLLQKELVCRSINCTDRRSSDVLISQKGIDLISIINLGPTVDGIISTHITEEEALILSDLLDKIRG